MQVEKPPVNGNARQKLAWLLGVLCSVLLILTLASGGMLLRHESQIAVHETRIGVVEQMLVRIESKLDRLLERKP